MRLPSNLRERWLGELKFALGKMQEFEDNPPSLMFYYSVFYTETSRILNSAWDTDILLIHNVVQLTHSAAQQRFKTPERVVQLPPNYRQLIIASAGDLVSWIEGNQGRERLLGILGRIAELGYIATGNGYYLRDRGLIRL